MKSLLIAAALLLSVHAGATSPIPETTLVELTQSGGFYPPPPPGGEPYCYYTEIHISNYGNVTATKCNKDSVFIEKLSVEELTKLTDAVAALPQPLEKHSAETQKPNQGPPSCMHDPSTLIDAYDQDTLQKLSLATYICGETYTPANARETGKYVTNLLISLAQKAPRK